MAEKTPKTAKAPNNDGLSRFVFSNGVPPVIILALAVILIAAILTIVLGHNRVWVIIGSILAVIFVIMAVFTLVVQRATRLTVELDDDGYRIINAGTVKSGSWSDVTAVSATPDWQRIVIRHGKIRRSYISSPQGDWSEQMAELSDEIRQHLLSSRES